MLMQTDEQKECQLKLARAVLFELAFHRDKLLLDKQATGTLSKEFLQLLSKLGYDSKNIVFLCVRLKYYAYLSKFIC